MNVTVAVTVGNTGMSATKRLESECMRSVSVTVSVTVSVSVCVTVSVSVCVSECE